MEYDWIQLGVRLLFALVLGGLVGLEREMKDREAGLRTYALVATGSALFTIIGLQMGEDIAGEGMRFDPGRIIQAVAAGIGFIGAGVVIQRRLHVRGLTTAAGLWTVAAIGVAAGAGQIELAGIATVLLLFVLAGLHVVEKRFLKTKDGEE